MTWTYLGDPSLSSLEALRFEIQDTNSGQQLMQDEELLFLLGEQGEDVKSAAIRALGIIISRLSLQGRVVLGRFEYDPSRMINTLNQTLTDLLQSGTSSSGLVYAGGISQAERVLDENDSDLIQPRFTRGIHDNNQV